MTLAISSNNPSITTGYTFKTNKTVTTEQNDRLNSLYTDYNDEKKALHKFINGEAPSTLEEFKNCFTRYNSEIEQLPIDWNKDFQEYMTSRGCKNESELKALNKTGWYDVSSLRDFCTNNLRPELSCTIHAKGIDEMAFRTFPMEELSVEDLSDWFNAVKPESKKSLSEKAAITKEIFGKYLDDDKLEDFNLCLDSFLEILEKEEEEARNNELKKIEEAFDTVNEQSEKVSSNEKTFSVDTELQKINAKKAYAM